MGLIQEIRKRFTPKPAPVREASGGGELVDPDEYAFRLVSGGGGSEFEERAGEVNRRKMGRLAPTLYYRWALGGGIVDMQVARVIGATVEWTAADEAVQEVVQRFVTDPDNDLESMFPRYVGELLVYGELFLPIFLTPENADVRLGSLRQDQVQDIVWKRGDAKKPLAILQRPPTPNEPKRLWVIPHAFAQHDNKYPPHPALTDEAEPGSVTGEDGLPVALPTTPEGAILPEIEELLRDGQTKVAGYCFYHRLNGLVHGRGHGIYERIADWLKGDDDFVFRQLRNAVLQAAFVWDVTIQGATKEQIDQWKKEHARPPMPGSVNPHNETVTWEAKTPALPAPGAFEEMNAVVRKTIGLAVGMPGHEVGAEQDVNRNTASVQEATSTNRAKRLQRDLASMSLAWLGYALQQKQYRGQLATELDLTVECVLPEIGVEDEAAAATAFNQTVDGAMKSRDAGLMLDKDARVKVYQIAGMDIPDDAEFDRQREEFEKKQEEKKKKDFEMQAAAAPQRFTGGASGNGAARKPVEALLGEPGPSLVGFRAGYAEVDEHLPGRHDQKRHGNRYKGGKAANASAARTVLERMAAKYERRLTRLEDERDKVATESRDFWDKIDLQGRNPTNEEYDASQALFNRQVELNREINESRSKSQEEIARETLFHLDAPGRIGSVITPEGLGEKESAAVNEAAKAYGNLVGVPSMNNQTLTVRPTREGDKYEHRSYHNGGVVYVSKNVGAQTVLHEIGHAIEHHDPSVAAKSQAFLERRTKGEREEGLASLQPKHGYDPDEKTKKDRFANPYTGKQYLGRDGKIRATEILSMGLEQMYANPLRFAREDPDFFDFTFNTLRGR